MADVATPAAKSAEPEKQPAEPRRGEEFLRATFAQSLLVPALAIVTALAIGALIIIFTDPAVLRAWNTFFADPMGALSASGRAVRDAYVALFTGSIGSPSQIVDAIRSRDLHQVALVFYPLSETVVTTTPLIFAGLSVALGFRAGLFNIGAEGQINVGGIVGAMFGFLWPGLPGPVHLALIIMGGALGGAIWGGIPGILKAKTGAHEVITTIMMNYISYSLVAYLLMQSFFQQPGRIDPISKPMLGAYPHLLGSSLRLNAGILVALGVTWGVAWLLNRTTIGFEFKAVGANPDAARTAGMSPTRTFVVVMALSGALSGLAGATQLASVTPTLTPGFSSGYGFDAIALALLGRGNPWGVVAASFLFGALRAGSRSMQVATQTPVDIVTVIQALVIVFVAAPALVRGIFRIKAKPTAGLGVITKGWGG